MEPCSSVVITIIFSILEILSLNLHMIIKTNIEVMKFRALMTLLMAFISLIFIYLFGADHLFHMFHNLRESIVCIVATILCFLGPLVQKFFESVSVANAVREFFKELKSFYQFRAIVIAPLTEEMIYRSFTCSLWELSGISRKKIIFLSPVTFGVCHFSNFFFLSSKSIVKKLLICGFQCCYTIVFGWWEAFVWLNTHCFVAVVLIHSFCNSMGFPDFGGALSWKDPKQKCVILVSYVVGLALFVLFVAKFV